MGGRLRIAACQNHWERARRCLDEIAAYAEMSVAAIPGAENATLPADMSTKICGSTE
jgi:hypothetical protein